MRISAVVAQDIVFELKSIINQEINFMNQDGIIIASTDNKRINKFHEGAQKVISQGESLIINEDNEYLGSKKGINMPIIFEEQIIGVIGITGSPKDVEHNGLIIKKMTEILIKDSFLKDVMMKKNERARYIINRILNLDLYSASDTSNDVFSYDYFQDHYCIVGSYYKKSISHYTHDEIFRIIDKKFSSQEIISIITNDLLYLFIKAKHTKNINKSLEELSKEITAYTKNSFYFGLGPISSSLKSANQSFQYAIDSLNWNIKYKKYPVLNFEEMDLGLLLSSVNQERISIFHQNILGKIPKEEFNDLKNLLVNYGMTNKSVNKTAEILFIHKNTVQYKLDKIYEYTAYNPRVMNDYVRLYLAFWLND